MDSTMYFFSGAEAWLKLIPVAAVMSVKRTRVAEAPGRAAVAARVAASSVTTAREALVDLAWAIVVCVST
jgi:hypothetical protein